MPIHSFNVASRGSTLHSSRSNDGADPPRDRVADPYGRLPSLDGIRAAAVATVVCVHSGLGHWVGGYLGVDMFFVLSGFLITTGLLREVHNYGRVRLLNFYQRRLTRLYPPLLAMLAIGCAFASKLSFNGQATSYYRSAFHAATYTMNYALAFGADPGNQIGITWSLAVEEHFYLVWPIVLLCLIRWRAPAILAVTVIVALYVASYVWTQVIYSPGTPTSTEAVYFRSECRIGSVLVGCALAWIVSDPVLRARLKRCAGTTVGYCALLVLGAELAVIPHVSEGRFKYLLDIPIAALATAAIVAAVLASPDSALSRVAALRPFTAVGRASYSIYLWQNVAWSLVPVHPWGLAFRYAELLRLTLTFAVV